MTHYHDTLPDRDRIRVNAQLKHEKHKAEAIDILVDALSSANEWWCNGIV